MFIKNPSILFCTPPFTQLNTPYPATAYIKGFLNTLNIPCRQADLGINIILKLFCKAGLTAVFTEIKTANKGDFSANAQRILALSDAYIDTIDDVILFLQGQNLTMAHLLAEEGFLPQAQRFEQVSDLEWAFGVMGTQDRAKHRATLYLEDIADIITECIDPYFGFSRYAEHIGRSANSFDELYAAMDKDFTYIDGLLNAELAELFSEEVPDVFGISVPFPGNLYGALRCGQWIKTHYPVTKIVVGGGFVNTELRSLSDPRVFEFWDFLTLDDGEAPLKDFLEYVAGTRPLDLLKRTFALIDGKVTYINHSFTPNPKQNAVGTPDYTGLPLKKYISVIEVANPMHRLWSDGRWNKLTMAHGCYWGKCTFCDISLDYIKVYEPLTAALLCDRMEEMIAATGENGFHFVDEAAPPSLMQALAIEILKRRLVVNWWANIRFEQRFTADLCRLLKASGCIAVSGGLEVASDRLLELIQKGVTVAQVARVGNHFTASGIMVHAYLMYGFPTQTAQETVDSLEMVRQMFSLNILQSAYWHQFAMTAHSPVGLHPEQFKVQKKTETVGQFANNDIEFTDPTGAKHELFSYGLKKSLFNFMHGMCFDYPLQKWFDFKVPTTTVPKNYIENALNQIDNIVPKPSAKIVYLGVLPSFVWFDKNKKNKNLPFIRLQFDSKTFSTSIELPAAQGKWLLEILPLLSPKNSALLTYSALQQHYETALAADFPPFWYSKEMNSLREEGILVL